MTQDTGSSKLMTRLFGMEGAATKESLAAAVEDARKAQFKILRWWWRGQPAIDRVSAVLEVAPPELGRTVHSLAELQGVGRSIAIEVFPYGIPVLDRVELRVKAGFGPR